MPSTPKKKKSEKKRGRRSRPDPITDKPLSQSVRDKPILPLRRHHNEPEGVMHGLASGTIMAGTGALISSADPAIGAQLTGYVVVFMIISIMTIMLTVPPVHGYVKPTTTVRIFTLIFTLIFVISVLAGDQEDVINGPMQVLSLGRGNGSLLLGVSLFTTILYYLAMSIASVSHEGAPIHKLLQFVQLPTAISAASFLIAAAVNPYISDASPCDSDSGS
jgi:hypothetical protein